MDPHILQEINNSVVFPSRGRDQSTKPAILHDSIRDAGHRLAVCGRQIQIAWIRCHTKPVAPSFVIGNKHDLSRLLWAARPDWNVQCVAYSTGVRTTGQFFLRQTRRRLPLILQARTHQYLQVKG